MSRALAILVLALSPSALPAQGIRFVDQNADPGGDGRSWATAYTDLQDALIEARGTEFSEIWVAEGTYRPDQGSLNPVRTFSLVGGVDVYGGFAGTESEREERNWIDHPVILSGDLLGDDCGRFCGRDDNAHHVIRAFDGEKAVRLDGFTIRGGESGGASDLGAGIEIRRFDVVLAHCTFEENMGGEGAAVHALECKVSLQHCTLRGNWGSRGCGALYGDSADLRIMGCEFLDNDGGGVVVDGGSATVFDSEFVGNLSGDAAGMACFDADVSIWTSRFAECGRRNDFSGVSSKTGVLELVDCEFTDNNATFGAVLSEGSEARVRGCRFDGNTGAFAAGMAVQFGGSAEIVDCEFANGNATCGLGGALLVASSTSVSVVRCEFHDNFSYYNGGAVLCAEGSFDRCVFRRNHARWNGGGVSASLGAPSFTSCLFLDNHAERDGGALFATDFGPLQLRQCTVAGNTASGEGGGFHADVDAGSQLRHTILWGNTDVSGSTESAQVHLAGNLVEIDHCCVEHWSGALGGVGNFGEDPQWRDPAAEDYRLRESSPCVDRGDPGFLAQPGFERDLSGNSRLLDGRLDRDAVVDTGCHEYSHVRVEVEGEYRPGSTLRILTHGSAGFPNLLFVGVSSDAVFAPHLGFLFVDLGDFCKCLRWRPAPSEVEILLPPGLDLLPLVLQQIAFGSGGANFSNSVDLVPVSKRAFFLRR